MFFKRRKQANQEPKQEDLLLMTATFGKNGLLKNEKR